MLVQNISPFRHSIFKAPCKITQVAGALYPEEGKKDFYLAWSTLPHQECRTCWLQEDNTPQSQEHLCGFSWPVTSSAQTELICKSDTEALTGRGTSPMCHLKHPEEMPRSACHREAAEDWIYKTPCHSVTVSQSIPSQIYGNLPQ